MQLEYEIGHTGNSPEFCVIWLHGLGADGHDFVPVVPELQLPDSPGVRFIFPHAPHRAVTINGGYVMRAWYDIYEQDLTADQDEEGIVESSKLIEQLIEQQISEGIAQQKIILAGFSQGGAMALHIGLRLGYQLAGIMALSCYLPLAEEQPLASTCGPTIPIFMAHGNFDPVVPKDAGLNSKTLLENAGYDILWKEYPMEHSVCGEEIEDISQWLIKVINSS